MLSSGDTDVVRATDFFPLRPVTFENISSLFLVPNRVHALAAAMFGPRYFDECYSGSW